MKEWFKIVRINVSYCDYLRMFDSKVSYNKCNKELRPFIGVLFEVRNCKYFAPLTRPKAKHLKMKNMIDFVKLDGGKLDALNFNNMIPVGYDNFTIIDLNKTN